MLFCKAGASVAISFVNAAIFAIISMMLIIRSRTVVFFIAIVERRVDNDTVHTCRSAIINETES